MIDINFPSNRFDGKSKNDNIINGRRIVPSKMEPESKSELFLIRFRILRDYRPIILRHSLSLSLLEITHARGERGLRGSSAADFWRGLSTRAGEKIATVVGSTIPLDFLAKRGGGGGWDGPEKSRGFPRWMISGLAQLERQALLSNSVFRSTVNRSPRKLGEF